MNIVLPVHHYPPRHAAGAELYTYRLARQLQSWGHDVSVVAWEQVDAGPNDALAVAEDVYEGVPVHRLSMDIVHSAQRREWTFNNPRLGDWFQDYLREKRPDLVHFQAGYLMGAAPLLATHAAGIPALLTLHDYWFLCPRHTLRHADGSLCDTVPQDPAACAWCYIYLWERRHARLQDMTGGLYGKVARNLMPQHATDVMALRRRTLLPALALPRFVISPSNYLASRFAEHVPDGRLKVIRLGIDLKPYENLLRNDHPEFRIGYIGQIAEHKGVHVLIQAFRMLSTDKPITLCIYGGYAEDDPYYRQLRDLAAGDERICFMGRVDNMRVPQTLADFDVTVVPSIWYENCPLAMLESHAAGTPIITSRLGGMKELVSHEVNGLHFAAGDIADLASQLRRAVDDSQLLARMRAGAMAAKPASVEDEAGKVMALYERCIQP
jgi:glycosyltransferase involved in cell wall biosynthesis